MFILSGLILEVGQNLFRDFWSPFSISFYFSSARNYFFLEKREPPLGRARAGLRSGGTIYSTAPAPQAQPPRPASPIRRLARPAAATAAVGPAAEVYLDPATV